MSKKILLTSLFLLAVAGLMLHYRIHNFMVPDRIDPEIMKFDGTRFLSFLFPLIDVVLVTALFTSRKTCIYGYLFNGIIVIYGTVFMAHYSIAEFAAKSVPPGDWLLKSTLPDIGIAWADFFTGKALYDLYLRSQQ
ncbi:MAG: hypothetical protein C4526_02550 [Nitrospiraceae bacterium]|nr:MAG: hypothetical protein C4526_02550 [Nitrospiraceae bacterium]